MHVKLLTLAIVLTGLLGAAPADQEVPHARAIRDLIIEERNVHDLLRGVHPFFIGEKRYYFAGNREVRIVRLRGIDADKAAKQILRRISSLGYKDPQKDEARIHLLDAPDGLPSIWVSWDSSEKTKDVLVYYDHNLDEPEALRIRRKLGFNPFTAARRAIDIDELAPRP